MARPVYVTEADTSAFGNGQRWQFAFELTDVLPEFVERCAAKLLNELLYQLLATRGDYLAIAEVSEDDGERVCDEIEASGVQTVHGAIVWVYDRLADAMKREW